MLTAADGKRGHEHHAAAGNRFLRRGLQFVERPAHRMVAIAVGALADENITRGGRNRVVVERGIVTADVTREEATERRGGPVDLHLHKRASQHVTGVMEPGTDVLGRGKPALALEGLHEPERLLDIPFVVEGERGAVLRVSLAIGILGILVLALRGVVEEKAEEIGRGPGREDRPSESLPRQPREPAGMIDVPVGKDDGLDRGRRNREAFPIALAKALLPLEQSAVDEDPLPVMFEQMPGAGDGSRGPEETQRRHQTESLLVGCEERALTGARANRGLEWPGRRKVSAGDSESFPPAPTPPG